MSDDRRAKSANIFDVARLAGVSHQTVSRVVNNLPNVRPATRARVEQAIAQLHYSPSPAARALVTRRTRTIGLITPDTADFGPTSIAMHFNVAARAERYNVDAVTSPDSDPAAVREVIEGLLRQRVDAIVLIVTDVGILEVVRGLDLSLPLVAAAATQHRHPDLVSIDQYRGARSAVRHLAELGHTRIHHLAGPPRNPDALERLRGWRDELAARALVAVDPEHGDWSAGSGYRIGSTLELSGPSAVFVANDHMAIAAMDVLRLELGLRIPEDVGVIGFDDVPQAAWGAYQLTTVCQRVEPMVDAAVTLLRERMSGQAPARDIVVPCVLVERKTVRPAAPTASGSPPGTGTRRVRRGASPEGDPG